MFTKPYDEMTREEKLQHLKKCVDAQSAGNTEEAERLAKAVPLHPVVANVLKKVLGVDFLVQNRFNLSRVEAEYGQNWIAQ